MVTRFNLVSEQAKVLVPSLTNTYYQEIFSCAWLMNKNQFRT